QPSSPGFDRLRPFMSVRPVPLHSRHTTHLADGGTSSTGHKVHPDPLQLEQRSFSAMRRSCWGTYPSLTAARCYTFASPTRVPTSVTVGAGCVVPSEWIGRSVPKGGCASVRLGTSHAAGGASSLPRSSTDSELSTGDVSRAGRCVPAR